ncbi:MAG: heme lyase CcmF/NrfE family subunit [Solirubrobacterales bacterium]|nr:heme lyase CcmF/NrfE family subunit [Solirubrobacterales bacterium]
MLICVAVIEISFLRDDFSLSVVANHSSIDTPVFYKLTAMWSSQEGSLLLWAFLLSVVSSVSLRATRNRLRDVVPWATAVMLGVAVFFTGLMLFGGGVNPFATVTPVPADGSGLNPLLQHPVMIIHPPMLYTGYVALTVPFAFAIGALASRRIDASWIRATRGFSLIAWTFLTFGIILGARWSYTELGWGGYWAWDPVENASLMPWLITTAFIHSIQVQEKRNMLKVWNASLVVASFALALLGTFLVRSGVLQSIHAFGDSTVGPFFLALIGVVVIGSTILISTRLDVLRSSRRIDSLFSREAVFLINNLLLVALCAVIFWGTFFPLISEAITGTRSTLAAPWFDRYTTPLAVTLVLFTGIGPMLAWRRISWPGLKRVFAIPLAVAGLVLLGLILFAPAGSLWAYGLFVLAAFTVSALLLETWRSAAARRASSGDSVVGSIWGLISRNRRRYGGYIVHIGFVVLLVGIAASSSFEDKSDVELRPGQSSRVGDYEVTYIRPTARRDDQALVFGAVLQVDRNGKQFTRLHPTRRYNQVSDGRTRTIESYFDGEATSEVGLKPGLRSDFWVSVEPDTAYIRRRARSADRRFRMVMMQFAQRAQESPSEAAGIARFATLVQRKTTDKVIGLYPGRDDPVTFRVIVSPMVSWIWAGALIGLFGALFALWPAGLLGRVRVRLGQRFGRPAGGGTEPETAEPAASPPGPRSGADPAPGTSVSAVTGEKP